MNTQLPDWRQIVPRCAAEIDAALENLFGALSNLTATTGDVMVEAAAAQMAIDRLERFMRAELESDLAELEGRS